MGGESLACPAWPAPDGAPKQSNDDLILPQVVSALSHALDLSTGQPIGHSVQTCILAIRLAEEYGLSFSACNDLYYASLLKDAGCSSNASQLFHSLASDDLKAKREVKTTDWTKTSWETVRYALGNVATGRPFLERLRRLTKLAVNQKKDQRSVTQIRCERGATLARLIGTSDAVADAIACLDEHWNGQGQPVGLRGEAIPLLSRFMLLAQTLEVYFTASNGVSALAVASERSGHWFDPDLVKVAHSLAARNRLWTDLSTPAAYSTVLRMAADQSLTAEGGLSMDNIALAFAEIVDAKSPFTYRHSNGVANAAVAIARQMQLGRNQIVFLRHAALLHDLGKLGVSNTILEKPGKLDDAEWGHMKLHPFYTWKVLNSIPGLRYMSEVAASHHEKLDGSGYFRGLAGNALSLETRILAVADVFDALSASRPYREAMPLEKVFAILKKDAPRILDSACVEALEQCGPPTADQSFVALARVHQSITADHETTCSGSAPVN